MAESRTPATGRLDIEWLAMRSGRKPANRISIDPQRAGEVEARARRAGFAVEHGARLVEFPGRPASLILYVSPDPARARALVAAEAPLLPPDGLRLSEEEALVRHAELGALLGFPACCVEEFGHRLRRGITRRPGGGEAHEDFVAAECAAANSTTLLARLNDLSPDRQARLVTFYPCRYDCPTAADYAGAVFVAAWQENREAAAGLRKALLGPMRIDPQGRRGPAAADDALALDFLRF